MLSALAAATTAIDALQALTAAKKKNAATTGAAKPPSPFDVPAATTASATATPTVINSSTKASGTLSSGTMSAMLDAQSASASSAATKRSDALNSLFGKLDGDGNGGISQAEFADKLGAGGSNVAAANSVFGKLDADGDGAVSLKELAAALSKPKKDSADDADKPAGTDPLLKALGNGANAVATATPLNTTLAASATSSYAITEQMIQRQAQAITASTTANSSLSINA